MTIGELVLGLVTKRLSAVRESNTISQWIFTFLKYTSCACPPHIINLSANATAPRSILRAANCELHSSSIAWEARERGVGCLRWRAADL